MASLLSISSSFSSYRDVIEKDDHPLFVFQDEWVDDLHVRLFGSELDQVGQVLETLGDHDQRPSCSGRRRFCNKESGRVG